MAKIDTTNLTVSFEDAESIIKCFVAAKEPLMVWGPPGIGKSDLMAKVANEVDRPLIDIRLALCGSEDIKGYPYIDEENKTMKFAISNEFPRDPDSTAIIFFDEINAAPQSTQLAMYQLILDRQIGEYKLPEGVSIVTAGNRETDKAGLAEMPKPLQNRFGHIEMQSDFDDWLKWAVNSGVNPSVVGFLSNFKDKLNEFNPKTSQRAFATPRSWAKASKMLNSMEKDDRDLEYSLIASCVGAANAQEFEQFRKIVRSLPDLDKILDGEDITLENSDKSLGLNYAIITSLLFQIKNEHDKIATSRDSSSVEEVFFTKFNNFFGFLENNSEQIGAEFVPMVISACTKTYGFPINMERTPNLGKLMVRHADLMEELFNSKDED